MTVSQIIKNLQYIAPTKETIVAAINLIKIVEHTYGGNSDSHIIEMNNNEYQIYLEFKNYLQFKENQKNGSIS